MFNYDSGQRSTNERKLVYINVQKPGHEKKPKIHKTYKIRACKRTCITRPNYPAERIRYIRVVKLFLLFFYITIL